jgi:RND family efflux transporter MFP subunit
MENTMKRNLIKYPVLLTLFTSLIVFTSCGDNRDTNRSGQSSISVKIETIAGKSKMNMLEFAGVVEGSKKVKLSTKLMGNVSYLPFDAGAAIKKGEVLVKIQSKDIEAKKQQVIANLNAAKAAHSNMERNFNRVKSLYEKGSATEKEFEDVTLGYKMTEAQVKAVSEMKKEIEDVLSYSVIRAPFDGFIVNKFVQAGDIAAPGYPLLIVENFNSFNVVANVSSDNINKVQKGNEVELEIDALNNKKVLGEILEVNPGAHPASKQYSIKVKINPDDETKKTNKIWNVC